MKAGALALHVSHFEKVEFRPRFPMTTHGLPQLNRIIALTPLIPLFLSCLASYIAKTFQEFLVIQLLIDGDVYLLHCMQYTLDKEQGITLHQLDDVDFLIGVHDVAREGSLRFCEPNGAFLATSSTIPPLIETTAITTRCK